MLQNLRPHPSQDTGTSSKDAKSAPWAPRRRSSGLKFFASTAHNPETSSKFHKKWESDYLKDLREHRPIRPTGSRPLPERVSKQVSIPENRAASAMSLREPDPVSVQQAPPMKHEKSASGLDHQHHTHHRARSEMPRKVSPGNKEEMARSLQPEQPSNEHPLSSPPTNPVTAEESTNRMRYRESGFRWMERQEARSLRKALEDMDMMEESKIHATAQQEATELVQKHQQGDTAHVRPGRIRSYREHLEQGAHARSLSQIGDGDIKAYDFEPQNQKSSPQQSPIIDNIKQDSDVSQQSIVDTHPNGNQETDGGAQHQSHAVWDSPERKTYMNMTLPLSLRKPSGRRRSSGPRARNSSGSLFRNPADRIYEEPQEPSQQIAEAGSKHDDKKTALASKTRNIASKFEAASHTNSLYSPFVGADKGPAYRSEIHKNPPTQSRNPIYTRNEIPRSLAEEAITESKTDEAKDDSLYANGMEIRSEEIRAATSRRMRDRSPKLPSPAITSKRPERPIVSFDPDPNVPEEEPATPDGFVPPVVVIDFEEGPVASQTNVENPVIPTINVPNVPMIQTEIVSDEDTARPLDAPHTRAIPTISIPDGSASQRPLPIAGAQSQPQPASNEDYAGTRKESSKTHWTTSSRQNTVQCASCGLPIAGRIVSAAGERFHPQCFRCHHCSEPLECVAFYPEPDDKREQRLARIHARMSGNWKPEEKAGQTVEEDGDDSLRFYCHLDFHEMFSPRCKSCKTPIETEVIVACGSTWHVGHFFCAECGDPFDPQTPFVEKNGYAWCLNCHAGRFSGKCKGCRKPVVKEGISALDAEWHESCFVCMVS